MKKRVAALARIAVRMTPMRRCRAMSREDRYSRRHAQSVIVALCKVVSLLSYFLFCLASALAAAADAAGCGIRARAAAIPTPRRSRGLSLQSFRQGYFPLVPAGVGYCAPDAVRHEMTHRRSGADTKQGISRTRLRRRGGRRFLRSRICSAPLHVATCCAVPGTHPRLRYCDLRKLSTAPMSPSSSPTSNTYCRITSARLGTSVAVAMS